MKTAVFTDSFLPGSGGTERAVYNVCKSFKNLGHEIIVFAPDYHSDWETDEIEVYRVKSIKLNHNDMAAVVGWEYRKILKKVKKFAPDIIYYCTISMMAGCAIKIAKKLKVPLTATVHTKFKESFYDSTKSKFITYCVIKSLVAKLNRTELVTTVSQDMKSELSSYGYRGAVKVIKNGVTDPCTPVCGGKGEIKGTVNFIFCGRLSKIKNVQFSIKSLAILKREKNFKNFTFTVVGRGPYLKSLKRLARRENVFENVVFAGFVGGRKEMSACYRKAHLLLFPSLFDNDSLVILEAAEHGVPAVTLKGCGSSERITDGVNGFLADNDERKFADKIYEIVTNKALYAKVSANAHTVLADSWDKTAEKYIDVFAPLCENCKNE